MIRTLVYLALGWLLIALSGGLADTLDLTVMLPATTAVVITHAAFASATSLPFGLFIAIALGYLEDLHQGAPVGTLTLAFGLSFLLLRWISARFHVSGWIPRSFVSALAIGLVDAFTYATLMVLAEPLGIRREALTASLEDIRWHVLATLLVAPPVWALLDRVGVVLKIDDRSPQHEHWSSK